MLEKTLPGTGSNVMGYTPILLQPVRSPFFGNEIMIPFLQSDDIFCFFFLAKAWQGKEKKQFGYVRPNRRRSRRKRSCCCIMITPINDININDILTVT